MEVKRGYKQTEVGVIPEEWDVARLSGLISSGPKNGYSGRSGKGARGTPTLVLTATTSGRMILDDDTVKYLEETIECNSDILLKAGDVLVQRSNTLELVGTTAIFDGPSGVYAYPDLMIRLRFKTPETADWFWRYANSSGGRRYFVSVAAGSTGTMPKLSGDKLRTMPLPLPSLPEQQTIAEALSDVDNLLEGLNKLIAKKRDVKQATMQQLLSGKLRLSGFHDKWETKVLGEIASISKGTQLHSNETNPDGHFPHFNGGVSPSSYTDKFNTPASTIAISEGGNSCGYIQLVSQPFWCGGHCYAVVPKSVNNQFLFHALKGQQTAIQRLRVGSGLPNIQKTALADFKLRIPFKQVEQSAIAEVLTDMDMEIQTLQQRREKTRALKQAMMQELLTGKTRLV